MTKLDRTWKNCLRMWKWISENWRPGNDIIDMKQDWLEKHRFTKPLEWDCFFCQWAVSHGQAFADMYQVCPHCPGRMVDSLFKCSHRSYRFDRNPKKFYAKLLSLNEKRTQGETKITN